RTHKSALVAVNAIASGIANLARTLGLLHGHARIAAVAAIGDIKRPFVGQRCLDARPSAHIDADLLACVSGEDKGDAGENAHPGIGDGWRLESYELLQKRRRIIEIEHKGNAGCQGNHKPDNMLQRGPADTRKSPAALVGQYAVTPVTLGPALNG